MNLNDFLVVPNKPKSVKLNVRNLRELRMETVQLDQENKDMENRLKELREIMSHEKEEREKSGAFRWKSAQANSGTRSKEKGVKLSAGKMKIRVLKDESLPEAQRPPEKVPGPPPRDPGHSRKPRLKGKVCGQCEARTAGLVCAECGEDYCVGCFARFHQKGALKHHRMIPVQVELQTSVSSLDVLSRFQKQIGEERETSSQSTQSTAVSPATLRTHKAQTPAGYQDTQTYSTQVLFVNEGEEVEDDEDKGSLLSGCFDEEASSRSFQQAVSEWRERKQAGDTADEREAHQPNRRAPVTVEVVGTQAGEMILQPIHIEFREHRLSYMEKLLLKKHRRAPLESYRLLPAPSSQQDLLMRSPTQLAEELTAEEMDLHKYCASLFAVSSPAGGERPDKTSKSCLSITEIDEMVGSPLAFSSSGVQQGDDKQKLNQGSEDSFTTSEEKPPSDQLSPLVRSQRLQIPKSEDLKLKLSVNQQVEHKLQRTQSPRLDDSPKPQMARSSAPLTPKFTFTKAALSSSPVSSKSSWRQGDPEAQNRDSFLLLPTNCPAPVFSLSSGPMFSPGSPDGHHLSSEVIASSAEPPTPKSHTTISSPRPVVPKCASDYAPVVLKSTSDSAISSPRPVDLQSTSHSPTYNPRPLDLKSTSFSPSPSPRPLDLKSISCSPSPSPRPLDLKASCSPSTSPRPLDLKASSCSPTTSPRPLNLKASSCSPLTSPRPLDLKSTSCSPTTSPRPLNLKASSCSPSTSPRPLDLKSTSCSPSTSPRPLYHKSTSHFPCSSPKPVVFKYTSEYPASSPRPVVLTVPSCSPTSSPSLANSQSQCPSPIPQQASIPLSAESPSLEDHSLALSDCFHPSSNSTRPTDLHRSPPPPSSPLSPSLSLSDSDSLSDSVGLIPADEDSSDEEMRGCADREQEEEEEEEEEEKSAISLHPTLSPIGDAPHSVQETPHSGLFTEPSQALISLAQRKASESQHYQGLEGFLTLGLDLSSVQPSPAPPHTPTERCSHSQELKTVGQGSWRPASSLHHYAEEELVSAVMNNQPISNSLHSATPTGSAMLLRRPSLPGSSRRVTPTFSHPSTADPAGTPKFQLLSRAAVEISEVQSVERPELTDSEDEDNEDDEALAGLEEELRRMSHVNPNRRT
ncbi:mucin-5AC isoform X1 [Pygocentrus nattereri]|uniref:B box-type domain-containing protein n=1 Tax=Pygocentrus nattereri TaxID=42514 RepID=A0A3B4DKM1_PYGNA|nr:mucin-5AC isoform X1 [Pygocentrus nattereri]